MILWLIFGLYMGRDNHLWLGGGLLLFILLTLLGIGVFGWPIKG